MTEFLKITAGLLGVIGVAQFVLGFLSWNNGISSPATMFYSIVPFGFAIGCGILSTLGGIRELEISQSKSRDAMLAVLTNILDELGRRNSDR